MAPADQHHDTTNDEPRVEAIKRRRRVLDDTAHDVRRQQPGRGADGDHLDAVEDLEQCGDRKQLDGSDAVPWLSGAVRSR